MTANGINLYGFGLEQPQPQTLLVQHPVTKQWVDSSIVAQYWEHLKEQEKSAPAPAGNGAPAPAPKPQAKVNWNGTVEYKGITYPNAEEFRRFNPDVNIKRMRIPGATRPKAPAPAPKPQAKVNWNGTVEYKGITYPNAEEFRRFNPDVNIKSMRIPGATRPNTQAPAGNGAPAISVENITAEGKRNLEIAKKTEQAASFETSGQKALDRMLGIGQETDATKYFRELEAAQAPAISVENITAEGKRNLEIAKKTEQAASFETSGQKALDRMLGIGQETDATKYFRELEEAQIGKNVGKQSKGFWSSLASAFKGKKGKAALGAGIATLLGVGIAAAVSNCSGDKKDEKVEDTEAQMPVNTQAEETENNEQVAQPEENANDSVENETPVVPTPVAAPVSDAEEDEVTDEADETENPAQVAETEKPEEAQATGGAAPVAEEEQQEAENSDYIVQSGDCVWNIAKKHLVEKHKDEKGYAPSAREIRDLTYKIIEDNNLKWSADHYHVMIHPNDKLKVAA